jgi:hypothetical protein
MYIKRNILDYLLSSIGFVAMALTLIALTTVAAFVVFILGSAAIAFAFSFAIGLSNFESHSRFVGEHFSDDYHLKISLPVFKNGTEYRKKTTASRRIVTILLIIGGVLDILGMFVQYSI